MADTCTPLETMEWLAAQFRDRADEDPEPHTLIDAEQVDEAKAAFVAMLQALGALKDRAIIRGSTVTITLDSGQWDDLLGILIKAEGGTNG